MRTLVYSYQWFSLFLLILSLCVSAFNIPRLGIMQRTHQHEPARTVSSSDSPDDDLKTYYYTQRLDHFNYLPESYATFHQRYFVNSKYWGGAKSGAPIFTYLGAEAPVDEDIDVVGFLKDNAPNFNALIVYIEHRYYGKSIPFGSWKEAMRNATTRGYFNSAQAIADYAAVILHLKTSLSAQNPAVIVFGGSYGG